jgi:cyanuric acid amidohydrolase
MTVRCGSFDLIDPDDFSGLERLLEEWGEVRRLGVLVKTEGDYADDTRERARAAVGRIVAQHGLTDRTVMVTVIGTEGISTPLAIAFAAQHGDGREDDRARLAMGVARGAPPAEAVLDRADSIEAVADVARAAMADGGLSPEQVAVLVVNIPAPTSGDAAARGRRARAVAAFGGGLALRQAAAQAVTDAMLGAEMDRFVDRVQTFTGPGIHQVEVIALGNRPGAGGDLSAWPTVAADLLDVRPLKRSLLQAGLSLDEFGELVDPTRVVACLAKAGARADGTVRGARTTIRERGIPPEKHVRAAHTGQLGALLGTTRMFNTFDPVHQAPDGGCTACFIVRAG